jgi:hypothetical protein
MMVMVAVRVTMPVLRVVIVRIVMRMAVVVLVLARVFPGAFGVMRVFVIRCAHAPSCHCVEGSATCSSMPAIIALICASAAA